MVDELLEEEFDNLIRDDNEFHSVADDLLDEIEKRLELLDPAKVRRTKQGWPLSWSWETHDRKALIQAVSRFSSNHGRYFGQLLTPLVNGIRVSGPFGPAWPNDTVPKLALLDGEGLGHTPKTSASISTTVGRRIDDVDAVLLVDNATQPMQAATVAAMRELASSGNVSLSSDSILLLRVRRKRPRYCRTAEKRNEVPSPHGPCPQAETGTLAYRMGAFASQQNGTLDFRDGSKCEVDNLSGYVR